MTKKKAASSSGAKQISKAGARKKLLAPAKKRVESVDGGRYVLIEGRRWRATDPSLPEAERVRLVKLLMKARRDVWKAMRAGDAEALQKARRRVQRAKVALGERGAKWWEKDVAKQSAKRSARGRVGKPTGKVVKR